MKLETANRIYDILAEHTEAPEFARAEFVRWCVEEDCRANEYRLNCNLGAGAKFRNYHDGRPWYVDYYQEFKKTDKQLADCKTVNHLIGELYKETT